MTSCQDHEEYDIIPDAFASPGFTSDLPSGPYGRLSIPGILTRGDLRADLFCREVCGKFSLSDGMASCASEERPGLERITLKVCSPADIFLFKTMTERDGDEDDRANIIRDADPDWPKISDEAVKQSESGRSVWITRVAARSEYFAGKDLSIPILDDMVRPADEYIDGWMRSREGDDRVRRRGNGKAYLPYAHHRPHRAEVVKPGQRRKVEGLVLSGPRVQIPSSAPNLSFGRSKILPARTPL